MTSNPVTIETDHHILSFRKKPKKNIRKGVGNHHAILLYVRGLSLKRTCAGFNTCITLRKILWNELQKSCNIIFFFFYSIDHTLDWFIVFFVNFFNFPLIFFQVIRHFAFDKRTRIQLRMGILCSRSHQRH